MDFNFSRPRPRTPIASAPSSTMVSLPQSPQQEISPIRTLLPSSSATAPSPPLTPTAPSHIRLSSIAESVRRASLGPHPDITQHPAFRPVASPSTPASPRVVASGFTPGAVSDVGAPWVASFGPNASSNNLINHGTSNGSSSSSSAGTSAIRETPPPAYTPWLARSGRPRKKRGPPVGTAITVPTLTRDDLLKEDGFVDESRGRMSRWKKLALALVVSLLCAVGLGVGLGLGLGLRKGTSGVSSVPPSTQPPLGSGVPVQQPFPLGAWSLPTYLTNVSATCTANSATWTCYPYSTYAASGQSSAATLNWIIRSSNTTASNSTLLISSSANPFSLSFTNASLILHDANTANERYSFSTPLIKQVWPTVALTTDNARDICFYNNSVLTATMYTRMPATLLSVNGTEMSAGYIRWPGAVLVEQTSAGGVSVPDCYRTDNSAVIGGSISAQAGLTAQAVSKACSCVYENAGLEGAG